MVIRVLRWLVPWACVVIASSAVAYAADLGLVQVFAALDAAVGSHGSAGGGMREIQIVHMHPDGPARVTICLAAADSVTSDVLEFWESAEVEQAARSLCVTNPAVDNRRGTH